MFKIRVPLSEIMILSLSSESPYEEYYHLITRDIKGLIEVPKISADWTQASNPITLDVQFESEQQEMLFILGVDLKVLGWDK
jgi:hypothetical protein